MQSMSGKDYQLKLTLGLSQMSRKYYHPKVEMLALQNSCKNTPAQLFVIPVRRVNIASCRALQKCTTKTTNDMRYWEKAMKNNSTSNFLIQNGVRG